MNQSDFLLQFLYVLYHVDYNTNNDNSRHFQALLKPSKHTSNMAMNALIVGINEQYHNMDIHLLFWLLLQNLAHQK